MWGAAVCIMAGNIIRGRNQKKGCCPVTSEHKSENKFFEVGNAVGTALAD